MAKTDLARRAVDLINRHDAAGLSQLYAQDAVVYDPAYGDPMRGRGAIEKDMIDFLRAFPDLHIAAKSAVDGDNIVAGEYAVSGTHNGPLPLPTGEVPPTGKRLQFEMSVFSRLNSQGLIVEEHRYYDVLGQMVQLGLLPEAEAVS